MEKGMFINGKRELLVPFCNIDTEYFRNEFIIDKEKFDEQYTIFKKAFNRIRHSYTYYFLFNEYYADTITLFGNSDNLMGTVTFNFDEFLLKIGDYLSVNYNISINDPVFIEALKHRINVLRNIKSEQELKVSFPKLHEIYINGNNTKDFEFGDYYDCGLRPTPDCFSEEQAIYFEHILSNLDQIKDEYTNYNIIRNGIEDNYYRDKLRLYIAYRLFNYLMDDKTKDKIPGIEIILKKYFDNTSDISDINVSIRLENGDRISFLELLSDYNRLYNNENIALWEMLPQGHDSTKEFHPPLKAMSDEEIKRLYNLNIEKYNFYESLKYFRRGKGKYLNTGYYAFFFSNGEQILDKLCYPSDEFIVSHYGNAIYNLNVHNFELLSRIDKTTLRDRNMCPFTTHQGDWKVRVSQMVMYKPATNESLEETKKLIKRIEKKA